MTIHVLIACSKTKSNSASKDLIWNSKTNLETWSKAWSKQSELVPANELYNGRAFKQQLAICQQQKKVRTYILSAGAGLISNINTNLPSYEATFQVNHGPSLKDWHSLPLGGLANLKLNSNDVVVSFAPPQYHRALSNDLHIEKIYSQLIVPSTSPLANKAGTTIPIHPRAKEFFGVADVDLNTAFLKIYFTEGIEGFNSIIAACDTLPPLVERRKVTDEELLELVIQSKHCESLESLVRHLRDCLKVAASKERISAARKLSSKKL